MRARISISIAALAWICSCSTASGSRHPWPTMAWYEAVGECQKPVNLLLVLKEKYGTTRFEYCHLRRSGYQGFTIAEEYPISTRQKQQDIVTPPLGYYIYIKTLVGDRLLTITDTTAQLSRGRNEHLDSFFEHADWTMAILGVRKIRWRLSASLKRHRVGHVLSFFRAAQVGTVKVTHRVGQEQVSEQLNLSEELLSLEQVIKIEGKSGRSSLTLSDPTGGYPKLTIETTDLQEFYRLAPLWIRDP